MKKQYISVSNGFAYLEYCGTGDVLLCLAGGPGCTINALKPYMKFLKKKYTLAFIDFVGVGKSKTEKNVYNRKGIIEQIDKTAEFFNKKISILGHSYGGLIAQDYMLERPDNLNSVILICSNTGLPNVEDQGNRYKQLLNEKDRKKIKSVPSALKNSKYEYAYKFYSGLWKCYYRKRPNIVKIIRLNREFCCSKEFSKDIEEDYRSMNLAGKFGNNRIPTYIVESENDYVWMDGKAQRLFENHPNSLIWRFSKSRHHPFYEEKKKFRKVMRDIANAAF